MYRSAFPVLLLAGLFGSRLAEAQATPTSNEVALEWNAPSVCPPTSGIVEDIHVMLGGEISRRLSARADVTEISSVRWSVHIVTNVGGVTGERTLEADSCASIASATALVLAWTIDPTRARAPLPLPARPSSRPSPARTPSAQLASRSLVMKGLVAVSGVGDRGSLPDTGAGLEVALGVIVGPVRVEVLGSDWVSQDAKNAVGEGAHLHLLEGAMRGCLRVTLSSRLEIDPCLGASLADVSSVGFAQPNTPTFTPSSRDGVWGSLRGDVLVAWKLVGPLALRASIGAGVPLARPPFVVVDSTGPAASPTQTDVSLHKPALVTGRASLGLEVRFP